MVAIALLTLEMVTRRPMAMLTACEFLTESNKSWEDADRHGWHLQFSR